MALTAKKVYAILKRQISDMEAKLNSPVRYRGTVATADLLPLNPDIGDMYNIESKSVYGEAGMNVAWNGVVWDTMGAPIDMSLYIKSNELADWVKQQNKPTYTAEEVGALPVDTKIPSKTSDLQNDSGFLTKIPDNYLSGTDKTLSVSGQAADAKTVGDKNVELLADILSKLDKNQGSENSGKIAGINESGDIVPMFPVSVDYNEETNCLEFGSDQKMELNKGINLDNTLTKTGYAADAGVVGEVTNSLKEDIEANKENIITLANVLNSSFTKEIQFEMIQNSVILKSNGKPYTNSKLSGYSVSDYIPVESGAYRVIASAQYDGNILYAIYDEGKNPIVKGDVATSSVTICDDVIFVPANGKYIVVSQISGKKSKVLRLADEMVFSPVEFDYEAKKCVTTKWTIADSGTFDFFIAKVPVIGGSKVKLSATTNWGNPHYGFENASGEIVSLKSSGNGIQSLTEEVVDIPTNASYILVNCYAKYPVKIETLQKPKELKWSDKKWVVIGDSLTNLNGRAYIHYFDYISLCTGISVQNMGVSDTGYAKGTNNNAFYQRLDDIDTSSDVITIFGSFNDLTSSKSLGNITDTGIETICGCINTTIDRIYEKMPLANLGIVAPCPWSQYTPMDSDTSTCVQYVNALENITKHRGIPYLDLFRTSGIRPWKSSIRDVLYTQDEGGGTHPNAKGHKILSAKFEGFLNSLLLD